MVLSVAATFEAKRKLSDCNTAAHNGKAYNVSRSS